MKGRYLKLQKGQNLIEFAVILPIFVIMVLGVIDLSRAMYVSYVMHRLSREGANLATRGNLRYDRVRTALQESARPLDMTGFVEIGSGSERRRYHKGAIYIYRIRATGDNVAQVEASDLERPEEPASQLGRSVGPGDVVTEKLPWVMNDQFLSEGQVIVLVETYYIYLNLTPIGGFITSFLPPSRPRVLGSKAVFYLN